MSQSYLGLLIWNGLSDDVKLSNNVNKFKHKVKNNFLILLLEKKIILKRSKILFVLLGKLPRS